jgi:hypothetical protein
MDIQKWMHAAEHGHAHTIHALLAEGCDINARTASGMTALMQAVSKNQARLALNLLDRGADVNARRQDGMSALMLAAFFGHDELVSALLDRGADLGAQDSRGTTALGWAASRGNLEVVQLLKKAELIKASSVAAIHQAVAIDQAVMPDQAAAFEEAVATDQDVVFDEAGATDQATVFDETVAIDQLAASIAEPIEAREVKTEEALLPDIVPVEVEEPDLISPTKIPQPVVPIAEAEQMSAAPDVAFETASDAFAEELNNTDDEKTVVRPRKTVYDYEPLPEKKNFRNEFWRIAAIVPIILLISSMTVYTIRRQMKQSSKDDLARPVTLDRADAQPVVPLPLPQASEETIQTESEPANTQTESASVVPTTTSTAPNKTATAAAVTPGITTGNLTTGNVKRSAIVSSLLPITNVPRYRGSEPVIISLAPSGNAKKGSGEETSSRPSGNSDQRESAAPRTTNAPDADAARESTPPVSLPAPAASPKKKVIQWP